MFCKTHFKELDKNIKTKSNRQYEDEKMCDILPLT
jgi:hypothetical protein